MTLEPANVVAGGEEEYAELHDMTRRFDMGIERAGVCCCDVAHHPKCPGVGTGMIRAGAIYSKHAGQPGRLAIFNRGW